MAREFPRLRVGDELKCSHLNVVYDELNRWRRARGAGLVDVDGADGTSPPTFTGVDYPRSKVAKNGASTVAAISGSTPGSGTVTLYNFDGTTLTAGNSVTAYNITSGAVAANAWLQVKLIDGFWFIDVEGC